ncbi:MAG: terminase large subunit domain-containing protein [Acidimicrobiales bacterium]
MSEPRFATKRSPERPTLGHEVAAIADELGQPLMPWQRQVADVALELLPDGQPAYREIVVLVARQNGKSTLTLCLMVQRCLRWPGQPRCVYSAQTGADSGRKLADDWFPMVRRSPLWAGVKGVARAAGHQSITFKSGGRVDVLASNEGAGLGRTIDLGIIDEALLDVDDRREAAMLPAMATRPGSQLFVISTAGTDSSSYLRRKVDSGRAAAADDERSGTCYFEWSADEAADPDSPATWRQANPAIGYTIDEETIARERATMPPGSFARMALNLWTVSEERVIPEAVWAQVCWEDTELDRGPGLVLALDLNPERAAASIAAADAAGRIELIEHRDTGNVAWVVDRAAELVKKYKAELVLDGKGPASSLLADLEAKGVRGRRVLAYGQSEMTTACATFYDAVADRRVAVLVDEALDNAVAAARRRQVGDSWTWGRRDTSRDVSPLIAATLAFHRATNPPPKPRVIDMRDYVTNDLYAPGGYLAPPPPGSLS